MAVVKAKKAVSKKTLSNKKLAARANGRAKAKYVYTYGGGTADGAAGMKNLLGGKGANLG